MCNLVEMSFITDDGGEHLAGVPQRRVRRRTTMHAYSSLAIAGNSSSAIGWLFKVSGPDPAIVIHSAHLVVARHLALRAK